MLTIGMLPAAKGDCIILKIHRNEVHQMIIIDGGMGRECIFRLENEILEWNRVFGPVDLVILTHIDSDHISGLLKIVEKSYFDGSSIKSIWFNYGTKVEEYLGLQSSIRLEMPDDSLNTSYRQGKEFLDFLNKKGIAIDAPVLSGMHLEIDECLKIDVLSPGDLELRSFIEDRKYKSMNNDIQTSSIMDDYDYSIEELNQRVFSESDVTTTNASSIACLVSYRGHSLMFLGDSKASVVESALRKLGASEEKPLKVDYCKVSHHGSKSNTSSSLLRIIDCDKYLMSSNWTMGRPSKECLARIVMSSQTPITIFCNYEPNTGIFSNEEYQQYKMAFKNIRDKELIIDEQDN